MTTSTTTRHWSRAAGRAHRLGPHRARGPLPGLRHDPEAAAARAGGRRHGELGYPASAVLVIGVIGLVALGLYLVPATSVLGAVVMTGYLGGAIATHMPRGQSATEPHAVSDYVALLVWGGSLYLRDARLRELMPCVAAREGQPTLTTIMVACPAADAGAGTADVELRPWP